VKDRVTCAIWSAGERGCGPENPDPESGPTHPRLLPARTTSLGTKPQAFSRMCMVRPSWNNRTRGFTERRIRKFANPFAASTTSTSLPFSIVPTSFRHFAGMRLLIFCLRLPIKSKAATFFPFTTASSPRPAQRKAGSWSPRFRRPCSRCGTCRL